MHLHCRNNCQRKDSLAIALTRIYNRALAGASEFCHKMTISVRVLQHFAAVQEASLSFLFEMVWFGPMKPKIKKAPPWPTYSKYLKKALINSFNFFAIDTALQLEKQ